jgi:very-short-patch-repair endonuclease
MRGKLIPFTEEDKKNIADRYASGVSVRALAAEYYTADVRIKGVLEDAGFRLKGAKFTREHLEDIANRYVSGEDVLDIAKAYRCRYYTMRDLINSLGVERRVITTVNTPIERRLHDALMKRGIGFTTQVRLVGRYVVDIKVNQAPVVIEADGKTYHRKSERDAERDRAHAEAGYRVFRFTGSEINRDGEACIQRVIDECGLTPDESPVYDIRTTFSGADHPRWNRITLKCLNCESEFERVRKHAHRKFCRLSCYHEYTRKTGIFKGGRAPIERPD